MKENLLPLLTLVGLSLSFAIVPADLESSLLPRLQPRNSCTNTPTSRKCRGQYHIDTNYYTETPDTKHAVEVWLSAEESICNQDGYKRPCMTFNGTMPGPAIVANWGDNLIVHVANRLKSNGTAIHWHGVRQQNSVEHDGVPGITQCPIAPGETFTFKFKVTQYGTTWYHSHYSLQYAGVLYGALIFRGPATADYDEDLGPLFLSDWSHTPTFTSWIGKERYGITQSLTTTLINGTNTFNCSKVPDPKCIGNGKKFQTVFQPGKKYLIHLIHVATDS
jgi:FtsP/CotA-like multicopper oxidase with cupredoxin domain